MEKIEYFDIEIDKLTHSIENRKEGSVYDTEVMSKTWTVEEEKEFSELIKRQKTERQQKRINKLNIENKRQVPALV